MVAVISLQAQVIYNKFELTVEDLPGSATNRAVVKARAVNDVVPTFSTCDGEELVDNLIAGLKFAIRWNFATSGYTNVAVTSTNNSITACPDLEENTLGGYGLIPGNTTQSDGDWRVRPFQMGSSVPIATPTSWILNEWMTICTLTISLPAPGCTNCNQLAIYMLGDNPSLEGFNDFDHILAFDEPGDGTADQFDLEPNNAPLPLDLVKFTAEKSENNALVEWTTVNEFNTSHFTVQRSYDKNLWFNIGEAKAAGFSTEVKSYNFTDFQVYNGRDARLQVYYRLNMVDLDGKQRYSPIQSIVWGSGVSTSRDFVIFPNPASEGVHVEWDANEVDQPTAIELYDIAGKMIMSVPVSDQTNQQYIDFKPSQIQSGLYLMRIMHNDEAIEHKQIVVGRAN